jgi:hypothetical protein
METRRLNGQARSIATPGNAKQLPGTGGAHRRRKDIGMTVLVVLQVCIQEQ